MNKRDYLEKLLLLCTTKQKDFFLRMYPVGLKASQINYAIVQVENALKNNNATKEDLAKFKVSSAADKAIETKLYNDEKVKRLGLEIKLKEAYALVERLKNPINTENNEIQERLQLLNALEAGGVDNWEWYSESISNYNGE